MNSNTKLTKRDIVISLSEKTGLTQSQVQEVIQGVLDEITYSVATGQDVELRNFGVFEVRLSKARVGRNPNQPDHSFSIPSRATVKFRAGKIMKEEVLKLTKSLRRAKATEGKTHQALAAAA